MLITDNTSAMILKKAARRAGLPLNSETARKYAAVIAEMLSDGLLTTFEHVDAPCLRLTPTNYGLAFLR
jgi:hypothetical protein